MTRRTRPPQSQPQKKATLTHEEVLGLEKLIRTLIAEVKAQKVRLEDHIGAETNEHIPPGGIIVP